MNNNPFTSKRAFTRLPRERKQRSFRIGAFDTETRGFTGGVKICTFFHEDMEGPLHFHKVEDFLEHILVEWNPKKLRDTIWYSHNGEFDWRFLLAHFREYDDLYEVIAKERMRNKFYEIEIVSKQQFSKNGRPLRITRFRDSMAIYGFSLAEFSKNFAPEYAKQSIGLDHSEFDEHNQAHIDYALNDVVCLVKSIQAFDDKIHEVFGVHLRGTISSTAFQAFLRFAPEGKYYDRQSNGTEAILRKSYFGGRVQLRCDATERGYYRDVSGFDINSSYPAQMRKGVPAGKALYTFRYMRGFPGFYRVRASIPDDFSYPFIPHRGEHDQLSFPVGAFEANCSSLELDRLVDLGGSFEVIDGFYFPDGLEHPFDAFVDICEKTRGLFRKTPTEIVIKLIQNSVYGKFGTKTEGREVKIIFSVPEDPLFIPAICEETGEDIPFVYIKEVEREANYMLPHWAAWITANARLALDDFIRMAGAENVYYCDTDSVKVNAEGRERILQTDGAVGMVYGQIKDEGFYKEVRFHAPKVYTAIKVGKDGCDYFDIKSKGVPTRCIREPSANDPGYEEKNLARLETCRKMHAGEEIVVSFVSPTSMSAYLKDGRLYKEYTRTSTNKEKIYGHRIENGQFRPRRIWNL